MNVLPHVLVVEDDAAIRGLLRVALEREPLRVDTAEDGAAALVKLSRATYAVLLIDLMMPNLNGFELLDAIRDLRLPFAPVIIVMSAYDDGVMRRLDASVVHACVRKPFDVAVLTALVRDCAQQMPAEGGAASTTGLTGSAAPLQ